MTTFDEMPSIKTAVELEARRRKRVYAMFLALLIIPVAIGIYAIAKAPSETELLVQNATPIIEKNVEKSVSRKVDRDLEPRVDKIVRERARPVIENTLETSIAARVKPLEQKYSMRGIQDDQEHEKTEARLRELEARVAALEKQLGEQPVRPQIDKPVTRIPKPVPVPR